MNQVLHGVILNYRLGLRTQKPNECLLCFPGIKTASEAARLVGKKVMLQSRNRRFIGKIVSLHGRKGVVRARFRKGVPGQFLGDVVQIIG